MQHIQINSWDQRPPWSRHLALFGLILVFIILAAGQCFGAGAVNGIISPSDNNGRPLVGLNRAGYTDVRVLAANTAESQAVPTGAKYVIFSGTANFYVNFSDTATVPAADVADGTASILNPGLRSIDGATAISIISADTCIVTMEFYQ